MSVFLLAVLAGALGVLPTLCRRWTRRVHPAVATKAIAASLAGALLATELTAVTLGAPVVLRAAGAHGLATRCAWMARHVVVGSPWMGWSAAVCALMLPWAVSLGFRRARNAQRGLHEVALLGRCVSLVDHNVVIVESRTPVAVSVAAHGGVVVVSDSLVEQLTEGELAAVLRHERAHLEHRHHVLLLVAAAADCGLGVLPWVRSSVVQLRCSIERWADEDAAGSDVVSRQSTRRALVGVAVGGLSVDVAAFGSLGTVVQRLAALEVPAPVRTVRHSVITLAPFATLLIGVLFTAAVVAANFWLVLTMPQFCAS